MPKEPAGVRPKISRWLGVALLLAGSLILILSLVSAWYQSRIPPYGYTWEEGDLLMGNKGGEQIEQIKRLVGESLALYAGWVVRGPERLARFWAAENRGKVALLKWEPSVEEPFIRVYPPLSELLDLVSALREHGAGKRILTWWDVSLALSLLDGTLTLAFSAPINEPLLLPPRWSPRGALEVERAFWRGLASDEERRMFRRFAEALVAEPTPGKKALCRMAGGSPYVLILHLRDIILLGALYPHKLGVAFKDFPDSGDVHRAIRTIYPWLEGNRYVAYSVMRPEKAGFYRVVALMDEGSANALASTLLPFVGRSLAPMAQPVTGEELVLVYQVGGFWVYEGRGGC